MNDFNDKRIILELRDRFMVVYHIRIFRIENRVNYVNFLHFSGGITHVNFSECLSKFRLVNPYCTVLAVWILVQLWILKVLVKQCEQKKNKIYVQNQQNNLFRLFKRCAHFFQSFFEARCTEG